MRNSVTDFNPEKLFAKTTGVAAIVAAAVLAVVSSFPASAGGYDQSEQALTARLKESKISLADGIRQAEKQYGLAISAKFELEDGALNLSVYNAKDGRGKDAEHNVLTEAAGDASKSPWSPKLEVFADKEHLTRSATQLTLVQTAKIGLADAVKKVSGRGTVYSVAPVIAGNATVYEVLVAAPDGKSTKFDIDAATGKVAVVR
jgi:uncharacterized membrane protein YkoI